MSFIFGDFVLDNNVDSIFNSGASSENNSFFNNSTKSDFLSKLSSTLSEESDHKDNSLNLHYTDKYISDVTLEETPPIQPKTHKGIQLLNNKRAEERKPSKEGSNKITVLFEEFVSGRSKRVDNAKDKIIPKFCNFAVNFVREKIKALQIEDTEIYSLDYETEKQYTKNDKMYELFTNMTLGELLSLPISEKNKKAISTHKSNKSTLNSIVNPQLQELLKKKNKDVYLELFLGNPSDIKTTYGITYNNKKIKGDFFIEDIKWQRCEQTVLSEIIHLIEKKDKDYIDREDKFFCNNYLKKKLKHLGFDNVNNSRLKSLKKKIRAIICKGTKIELLKQNKKESEDIDFLEEFGKQLIKLCENANTKKNKVNN